MFSIPIETILYHFIPFITGLLLLLILAYLIVVKHYKSACFPFYSCFLICLVIFLIGRPLQFYGGHILAHLILYARFFILFAIGFPSLLIANKIRCGITLSRFSLAFPFIIGILGAAIFVVVRDGCTYQILVAEEYGYILPSMFTEDTYSDMLMITTALVVVFPSLYLFVYHIQNNLQIHTLLLLICSLFLGSIFIVGEITDQYWLFYLGSFLVVSLWLWVGYLDIQSHDAQTSVLKEGLSNISLFNPKSRPLVGRRITNVQPLYVDQGYNGHSDETANPTDISLNKPTVRNRELVNRAISYIKANFNKEIEIGEIANYTDVSDSYLVRIFKKVTGKTINQYITCFRVQRAQQLLKNHTVIETSHAVGFKNPSYFSTVFKKHTGLSPSNYQRQSQ